MNLLKLPVLATALACLIVAALPARADTACEFDSQPTVLMEEGDPHDTGSRLLKMWEVEDHPVFWSETVPDSEAYSQFRAEVADLGIETDPVRLLERSSFENSRIVLRNASELIKPAGCLEMLMYGYQHARLNTFTNPTEFGSIILRSPDEDRLRVYYYTNNQDGLGNMDPIVVPVLEDKREGWEVLVALHTHVFHPGQPEIDGILAPSEPDADFHVRLHESSGLREAWITNGIHTVRMPASSFNDFERPAVVAQETDDLAVRERIEELVRENFYDVDRAQSFSLPEVEGAENESFDAQVSEALADLGASHTGRWTRDQIDYFELLDIYHVAMAEEIERLFPDEDKVTYPGIGMIAHEIDGSHFAVDVYHAGSAARAGVREGDEIVAVDGEPYSEIGSFEGKVGEAVTLLLRREADAEPVEIEVEVEAINPNEMFTASISGSIEIIGREGHRIGYIRMWSFTSDETRWLLHKELGGGLLADADALVIDLRSRWGGAPLDAAEMFVGRTPAIEILGRDGTATTANARWRKPVVAIIDEGTRSGLELFAHALKVNGVPLVGAHTARAVVAGTAFMLPDDSLLSLAVSDVVADGIRLEETGVEPDMAVERDIRYENGADPQIEAAIQKVGESL